MIRPSLASTAVLLAVVAAPRALAQTAPTTPAWTIELSPGAAYLLGHTTYRIEGSDGVSSVVSELEFPVNVGGIGLQARIARAREAGRGGPAFEVRGFLSVPEGSGTMKDSDWLSGPAEVNEVGASHDGKDIYSESTADVSARALEARGSWEFATRVPGVLVAPFAGVLYQRFEFDVRSGTQWGYGPWNTPEYTGSFTGHSLDYRVSYLVPYIGGRAALSRGSFRGSAELWLSPVASASDRDDHLLRQKLSTTDASGSAWSASVGAGFTVGARDMIQATVSVVGVRATGNQHQRFYGGPYAGAEGEIPSTITSSRAEFALSYTHAL